MDYDDRFPQPPRLLDQVGNDFGRDMCYLCAWQHLQRNKRPDFFDGLDDPRDDEVDIRGVHMVGDRKRGIPFILRPPDQFERDKFSIAEYGVSMQIYHLKKIQEDGEKCKAISSIG